MKLSVRLTAILILLAGICLAQKQETEVAPGLKLTSEALVWLLHNGNDKKLMPVPHHDAVGVDDVAGNIVRSTFFMKQQKLVVIPGIKSAVRITSGSPSIFVQMTEAEERELSRSGPQDQVRYALIRLEPGGNARIVGRFQFSRFKGTPNFTQTLLETRQSRFHDSPWLELVPAQPLKAGEYALVQVTNRKDMYNQWVFDFGVDEPAPQH